LILADIDPSAADQKHKVVIPGELEVDMIKDRRPEFYGLLAESMDARSRGQSGIDKVPE
jgi:hypothetical protein